MVLATEILAVVNLPTAGRAKKPQLYIKNIERRLSNIYMLSEVSLFD